MPYILEPNTFLADEKTKEVTGYYQYRQETKFGNIVVQSTPETSAAIQEVLVEIAQHIGSLLVMVEPLDLEALEGYKESLPLTRRYLASVIKERVVPSLTTHEEPNYKEHIHLLMETTAADVGVVRLDSKIWTTSATLVFHAIHSYLNIKRIYMFTLEWSQQKDTRSTFISSLLKFGLNEEDAAELAAKVSNGS